MKGTKAFLQDLREKSPKELVLLRRSLQKELYTYKMKNALKGLKETHKIRELKSNIARINTILTHKTTLHHGDHRK